MVTAIFWQTVLLVYHEKKNGVRDGKKKVCWMQRHPNFARDFLTQDGRINQSDVTLCFISLITNQVGFFLSLMTPPSGSWQQISCSTFTLCSLFFLPCSLHTHIDRLVDLHIVGLRADHRGGNSALLWPWVVCLSLIFSDFFPFGLAHFTAAGQSSLQSEARGQTRPPTGALPKVGQGRGVGVERRRHDNSYRL